MPRIPDIPGDVIEDVEHVSFLKEQVARLCGLDRYRFVPPIAGNLIQCLVLRSLMVVHAHRGCGFPRFPGSQPISFGRKDLIRLEHEEYVRPSKLMPFSL